MDYETRKKIQELRDKYIDKARSLGVDHVHEITGDPTNGWCIVCKKLGKDILLSDSEIEPFMIIGGPDHLHGPTTNPQSEA